MNIFLLYVIFLALMWWWMSKGNKKRKAAEEEKQGRLTPGVYVMLKDGLFGTVVDVDADTFVVNLSVEGRDEGCVVFSRQSLESIVEEIPPEHLEAEETETITEYQAAEEDES